MSTGCSMSTVYLPSTALDSSFPLTVATLYNYKSVGRVDWMIRRGRILWLNIAGFNAWAQQEGKAFRLPIDHPQAVELQIEEGELAH